MAASVKRSSATLACVYTHLVILVILCVYNFSLLTGAVIPSNGLGLALLLLSIIATVLGMTSQDPDQTLLRSLLLCTSALWTSMGVYHLSEGLTPTSATDAQALGSGFSGFIAVFAILALGSCFHSSSLSAMLSLGYSLACIFELCTLWRPLRAGVGAYYLLMAILVTQAIVRMVWIKFRTAKIASKATTTANKTTTSKDYVLLGQAMNTLAFAVCAGQVSGLAFSVAHGFSWLLTAGLYLLVAGVVALRRSDAYRGFCFVLYALFWLASGFNFGIEAVSGTSVPALTSVTVMFVLAFSCLAVASLVKEVFQAVQNLAFCVLVVALHVDGSRGLFVGVTGVVLFVTSLYGLAAHVSRAKDSSSFKLPLGMRCLEGPALKRTLERACQCCVGCLYGKIGDSSATRQRKQLFSKNLVLGYSKYLDMDVLGFASNAVAVMAILWVPQGQWVLPWAVVVGGLVQYLVGSVSFARGLTFESCSFFMFGSFWLIWGAARGLGVLTLNNGTAVVCGSAGFLCVGILQLILSLTISKTWTALVFTFDLIVIGFLLFTLAVPADVYHVVTGVLFVLVCLYGFLSTALKTVFGRDVLPLGKPVLQVSFLHSQGQKAIWTDARRATGVKAIADIMNRGGICGMPTDVVYVLVAAVKFPQAVLRAYNTKKGADDRPMSMWISKTNQLDAGRELFGELVWAFMNEVWPSTVSCVIPKGPWLDSLGIGEASKFLGRPDSIAVRMPDNCVTSYLIDQTGPVAVTSANPTGEADTTHHLQVLAKLGLDNVDGILCSGPSPENMASTVVDTRRMAQGQLTFFRIGVVPRAHVEAKFDYVKARFNNDGPTLPPFIAQSSAVGQINAAFVSDETDNSSDDSGVVGIGDVSGSQEDKSVVTVSGHDNNNADLQQKSLEPSTSVTEIAETIVISGRENPTYESAWNSSKMDGNLPSLPKEVIRQFPETSSGIDRQSPTPASTPDVSPYEPMLLLPSSAAQVQGAKEIGGRSKGTLEQRFMMNPLFIEDKESKDAPKDVNEAGLNDTESSLRL